MADLEIQYIKLHFSLVMEEETTLPKYKVSALRGGMGEVLLRKNCIEDRNCEKCRFEEECIVRRMMYSKMKIQPKFMSQGDSVGYVIECEDYRDQFREGDTLRFNLILFGRNAVYFNQYLDACYTLGRVGLGSERGRYTIASISNTKGEAILNGYDVDMAKYRLQTVEDYIAYRMDGLKNVGDEPRCIKLQSPLSLKYQGKLQEVINMEAILQAVRRRLYMLCCFEGIDISQNEIFPGEVPELVEQSVRKITIPRYSFHKQEKMVMRGIEGVGRFQAIDDNILRLLIAGELIHIGKNTSFGFGRYRLK